jgi:hypothetical protein
LLAFIPANKVAADEEEVFMATQTAKLASSANPAKGKTPKTARETSGVEDFRADMSNLLGVS